MRAALFALAAVLVLMVWWGLVQSGHPQAGGMLAFPAGLLTGKAWQEWRA